jgi:hypothetical protein
MHIKYWRVISISQKLELLRKNISKRFSEMRESFSFAMLCLFLFPHPLENMHKQMDTTQNQKRILAIFAIKIGVSFE